MEKIQCHFCSEKFPERIVKNKIGFYCPNCEQYNGFDENTSSGYNRNITQLFDENLNSFRAKVTEEESNLDSVLHTPVEFCENCVRSQQTSSILGKNFKTCEDCRKKVVEKLKRIQNKTEEMYVSKYTVKEKFYNIVINFCLLFLLPVEIGLFFMIYNHGKIDMIDDKTFVMIENYLYYITSGLTIPLFLQGLLFPLLLNIIIWNGMVKNSLYTAGVTLILTIFKIVYDEYRRVKKCSNCSTDKEKRECYFYDNLFNEEDDKPSPNIQKFKNDDDHSRLSFGGKIFILLFVLSFLGVFFILSSYDEIMDYYYEYFKPKIQLIYNLYIKQ